MQALQTETLTSDKTAPGNDVVGGPSVGTRLGRYTLVRLLGAGGFGSVFAAYDSELQREVALKLLRGRSANDRRRLLDEARALARVRHDNVVGVLDAAEIEGRVVLAMPLVRGRTLKVWLDEQKPHWTRIVAVFTQVADGLAAAHAAGLIHRDVKPSNILIDETSEKPVLVDFGIALSADVDEGEGEGQGEGATGQGSALPTSRWGTPAYMSPEQMRGHRLDARSDQYALSVALAEALLGERPFVAADSADLLTLKLQSPPRLVARRGVEFHVWESLRRSLEPDPEDRFPSIIQLAEAWRAAVSGYQVRYRIFVVANAGAALTAVLATVAALTTQPIVGLVGIGCCAFAAAMAIIGRSISSNPTLGPYRGQMLLLMSGFIPLAIVAALDYQSGPRQAFGAWLPPILWGIFIMGSTLDRRPWLPLALGIQAGALLLGYWWLTDAEGPVDHNLALANQLYRAAGFVVMGLAGMMVTRAWVSLSPGGRPLYGGPHR